MPARRGQSGASPIDGYLVDTASDQATWDEQLYKLKPALRLPTYGLTNKAYELLLQLFRTPGCTSLSLYTPRLTLRQVDPLDLAAITRIKTEPTVQNTQLYGSPRAEDIRLQFLNRYIRSSMPRCSSDSDDEYRAYIFAITLNDPTSVIVRPRGQVQLGNAIRSAEGYIGNIALDLELEAEGQVSAPMYPQPGRIFHQPTFAQTAEARLVAHMYYEIHPQLWGNRIMSEAFEEVLRFAMEEVGCVKVTVDPTTINTASVRLCAKNGLRHTHTDNSRSRDKPQMFHEITRAEWWARNRPGRPSQGLHTGEEVCRWCMNWQAGELQVRCKRCGWGRYCSRECQRADWVRVGGHQSECQP